MLNENAQIWVDALRSGRFEQARGRLSKNGKHCCLGVACVVAMENGVELTVTKTNYEPGDVLCFDDSYSVLPAKVREWLGLTGNMGSFTDDELAKTFTKIDPKMGFDIYLTDLNDLEKYDFNQIADVVESEPEGLFEDE